MTFIRYTTIQILSYGIDMGLFLILMKLGLTQLIFANILAKFSSGIFSFITHRHFTFRVGETQAIKQQAIRYFLLLALNIPITSAMFMFLLLFIKEPASAKFIADLVCVAFTYGLSKYLIFVGKPEGSEQRYVIGTDL